MFTLSICTILNGYTQVNIKSLLIQTYHTTCVSFSFEFIYQLIRFARASSHVTDFNNGNIFLTDNFFSKAIGIIDSTKHFPNFIVGTLN